MAARIFINYRRDDERAFAARLRDRLAQAFGESGVFMDVDNLMAGQRFDRELATALAETDVFLAVIGPRWLELLQQRQASGDQDYVRQEIAAALKSGATIIPVTIEQTDLPRADQLPDDIRDLILFHKQTISHEYFGQNVAALVNAIKATRKGARTTARAAPTVNRAALASIAGIGIILALAVWVGQYIWNAPPPTQVSSAQPTRTPAAVSKPAPAPTPSIAPPVRTSNTNTAAWFANMEKLQLKEVAPNSAQLRLCPTCNPTAFICRTPIRSAADVKGRKIRVATNKPDLKGELEALGAVTVALPAMEAYPALQLGVIDCVAGR